MNLFRASRRTLSGAHVSTLAAHAQLQPQQRQAQHQQYGGEHRRVGIAELQLELLIDRRGEGLQADDRQGAELHQHVQGNQQRTRQQRRPEQGQGDAKEHAPAILPQRASRLFQGRIEIAQGCRHGQKDQRILGQAHHQDRPAESFEMSAEGNPCEAADKGRYGKRQAENHAPQSSARQIAALEQPGQRQADHPANNGDANHQCECVAQQAEHIRSP
ncbi:hypothetical protein D3C71_1324480 [compost metagenome]